MVNRARVTVRQLAQKYEDDPKPIGQKIGRDWRFTDEDVERIKVLQPPDEARLRRLPEVAP